MKFGDTRGENNPQAKLRRGQVEEIIRRRRSGERADLLAKEFGVSPDHVYQIARGAKWRSIA